VEEDHLVVVLPRIRPTDEVVVVEASLSFRGGTKAYLIASTRPNRGKVRVCRMATTSETISLYSTTTKYRRALYLCSLKGSGKHTIRLVAVPRSGRRYIDVDGLAVRR
jgi:hypothetical protein